MNTNRINCWQPTLTDHQAHTFSRLAEICGQTIRTYEARSANKQRIEQGWTNTKVTGLEKVLIPRRASLLFCIRELVKNRNQIHVFGSPFEEPFLTICLIVAVRMGIKCFIISEPYSTSNAGYLVDNSLGFVKKIKARLRPAAYKAYVFMIGKNLKGVFAISNLACEQYERNGVMGNKIFPFGYFVPSLSNLNEIEKVEVSRNSNVDALKVIFVGSLIERKGISDLLVSFKSTLARDANITLDIYGHGDVRSLDLALFDSLRYCGTIKFGEAQKTIQKYDLLVLPSVFDGWGVVVNEAICAGVPVICSSKVGASVLPEKFNCGIVYEVGNTDRLAEILVELSKDRARLKTLQAGCLNAKNLIQPIEAACYMMTVFNRKSVENIESPWY